MVRVGPYRVRFGRIVNVEWVDGADMGLYDGCDRQIRIDITKDGKPYCYLWAQREAPGGGYLYCEAQRWCVNINATEDFDHLFEHDRPGLLDARNRKELREKLAMFLEWAAKNKVEFWSGLDSGDIYPKDTEQEQKWHDAWVAAGKPT